MYRLIAYIYNDCFRVMNQCHQIVSMDMLLTALVLATLGLCSCQGPILTQITEPVEHGEGPHWDRLNNVFNFVDINDHKLYQLNSETGELTSIDVGGAVGFVIPVEADQRGRFIAGRDHELIFFNWDGQNNVSLSIDDEEVLASVDNALDQEGNRWNDAKADATGRLWAGTMGNDGSLYSLETGATVPLHQVNAVSVSNGIAWNKANTIMYYIDTPTRRVDAFEYFLQSGVISNRRPAFDFADHPELEGSPDGMTIDSDDNLWVALWGGSGVIKVNPLTSELLLKVPLPANQVTSVTFGGSLLDTLYVTTSRAGLSEEQIQEQPLAGAVFTIEGLGVVGLPANHVVRD